MAKIEISDALKEMEILDERLFDTEFAAPYLGKGKITTSIEGIVYSFVPRIPGKASQHRLVVWKPVDTKTAKYMRAASTQMEREYYNAFPRMLAIPIMRVNSTGSSWVCVPWDLDGALQRFGITGPFEATNMTMMGQTNVILPFSTVRVALTPEPLVYEMVQDVPWQHELRSAHAARRPPFSDSIVRRDEALEAIKGLTPAGKLAVQILLRGSEDLKVELEKQRIRAALGHMDAELINYTPQGDNLLAVRWKFQGIEYRTTVQRDDLEVVSAGVCLSGRDRKFDLTTIVSVMKERQARWGNNHLSTYSLF